MEFLRKKYICQNQIEKGLIGVKESINYIKKKFKQKDDEINCLEFGVWKGWSINRFAKELNNTKIIAPFDGLLESDTAEYGDFMQTGAPCGALLALNPIKLIGYATETQVSKIEVNTTAGARLISGDTVSGTVSFISRSADPTTRTFLVETTVPNENYEIREGSTADIYISLAGAKGHLLPQSSLTLNSSGVLGVRIALDDKAKFIPINIIRDAEEGVWVTGLPNSVDVIIVGQEYVTDNSNIKVSYKVSQ